MFLIWRVTVVKGGPLMLAAPALLVRAQNALSCGELPHLGDRVLLHLLEFLGLLSGRLKATTLHQNELSKKLSLLEQEVEFLPALQLARQGCLCRAFLDCSSLLCGGAFTLHQHFGELATLVNSTLDVLTLTLLLLLNRLAEGRH